MDILKLIAFMHNIIDLALKSLILLFPWLSDLFAKDGILRNLY